MRTVHLAGQVFEIQHAGRSIRKCTSGPDGGRCPPCAAIASLREAAGRRLRIARLAADPSIQPHGCENTYKNWGCRCLPCHEAASDHYAAQLRANPVRGGTRPSRVPYKKGRACDKAKPIGREWLNA